SGIPACFFIQKAFFYTGGSGSGPTINLSVTNPVATNSVFAMVNSGFSSTDKWGGYGGTWTRRADVTALISGNGNYIISGIPTGFPNDPDGGTLVIVYSDNTQTFTGSMVLADGTMAAGGGGNLNSVITGFNACANSTLDKHFIIAGDLQSIGTYNVRYNSLVTNYVYPSAGQSFYAYLPFSGSAVTAGQTTANYGLNNSSADAFAFYACGLYYRTTCNACPGGACAVLPIELLSFDAKCDNGKVNLIWETATEINNDHFTIVRSADGINYETVGTIAGAGNSNKTLRYSFADPKPLKGTSYYSLKQSDYNIANKNIRSVAVNCTGVIEFAIHPNPGTGTFIIDGEEQNSDIIITDVFGKIIFQDKIIGEKKEIDLNSQQNGIYFVKIISESGITSNKIVINK
ncbi:MAG TPA: T9SS type A sorting domain-containing protein, partial [Bacteroidia bacterium]|nr:T9SS type A sorting domain-containing protein [Bacteroidia bacterium]